MKECRQCGTILEFSEFPLDKSRKDGYHPYCRKCKAEKQRNREHAKTKIRQIERSVERTCHRCKIIKPLDKFDIKYHDMIYGYVICIECQTECKTQRGIRRITQGKDSYIRRKQSISVSTALRRRNIRIELANLVGKLECNDCKIAVSNELPIECFDFHHIDPSGKEFNISHAYKLYNTDRERMINEVKKCVLLCTTCHRKTHIILKEENYES